MSRERTGGWDPRVPHDGLQPLPPLERLMADGNVRRACAGAATEFGGEERGTGPEGGSPAIRDLLGHEAWNERTAGCAADTAVVESTASALIENEVDPADGLLRAMTEPPASPQEKRIRKLALLTEKTLAEGIALTKTERAGTAWIDRFASVLHGRRMTLRQCGVHIGDGWGGVKYTPPRPERVPEKLEALWRWREENRARTAEEVICAAAAEHLQYESIHPHRDGNGRTGRALIQKRLAESGLTAKEPLPVSGAIWRRRNEYYAALSGGRDEGGTATWIAWMAQQIGEACRQTRGVIGDRAGEAAAAAAALVRAGLVRPDRAERATHALWNHRFPRHALFRGRRSGAARTEAAGILRRHIPAARFREHGRELIDEARHAAWNRLPGG